MEQDSQFGEDLGQRGGQRSQVGAAADADAEEVDLQTRDLCNPDPCPSTFNLFLFQGFW